MTADLGRLRTVLERELRDGCHDALVQGGLDELLRRQARGEQPGSPLLRMIGALPERGYASLDGEQRRSWLRRAVATAVHEQATAGTAAAAPSGNGGSTQRPGRAPARPAVKRRGVPSQRPSRARAAPDNIPPGAAALDLPLRAARTGLRGATFDRLERLGLRTVGDALRHYPYRHHDFSRTVPVAALRPGVEQTVRGTVEAVRERRMGRGGRMRSTEATLIDESGAGVQLVWFNQPWLARQIKPGSAMAVAGSVRLNRGRYSFQNPEFEVLDEAGGAANGATHTGRMVPVYHLTEGLAQRTLRSMIAGLLERFADRLPEPLPASLRERHGLPGVVEATRQVHYPDSRPALDAARRRLAFDELLALQLGVVRRKREWQQEGAATAIVDREAAQAFIAALPFDLTAAQQRALDVVLDDVAQTRPMARLLQGDVGSGKTVVALAAMLSAVAAGHQAALMAPTEVLAAQHFRTVSRLLSGGPDAALHGVLPVPYLAEPLRVVLLTGSTPARERREALEAIAHGGAHLVIGTHALIEKSVQFHSLALAVVDEQHRFGVMQRAALRSQGTSAAEAHSPHLLVMSATPIPRSLALTLFGDLDLTIIDEMPPGRPPVETHWLPPLQRREAFEALRTEVLAGRQGFVICPLVEGSETVVSRAATEEHERLRTEQFSDLADRIALLHGRMSGREKDAVMTAFASGETAVLVSTSVVEVGIDVPNATVMVIEGADRFGLAQLHQFRGRVGRGEHPSVCYLLADDPTPEAEERLSTVERTSDGFALAQADLELRGPGEVFGKRQAGVPSLRVASLLDGRLIDATRREAEALLDADPELAAREHWDLRQLAARLDESVVAEAH